MSSGLNTDFPNTKSTSYITYNSKATNFIYSTEWNPDQYLYISSVHVIHIKVQTGNGLTSTEWYWQWILNTAGVCLKIVKINVFLRSKNSDFALSYTKITV